MNNSTKISAIQTVKFVNAYSEIKELELSENIHNGTVATKFDGETIIFRTDGATSKTEVFGSEAKEITPAISDIYVCGAAYIVVEVN